MKYTLFILALIHCFNVCAINFSIKGNLKVSEISKEEFYQSIVLDQHDFTYLKGEDSLAVVKLFNQSNLFPLGDDELYYFCNIIVNTKLGDEKRYILNAGHHANSFYFLMDKEGNVDPLFMNGNGCVSQDLILCAMPDLTETFDSLSVYSLEDTAKVIGTLKLESDDYSFSRLSDLPQIIFYDSDNNFYIACSRLRNGMDSNREFRFFKIHVKS